MDLANPTSEAEATAWWLELTEKGGEGMVVKPMSFVALGAADCCNWRSSVAVANTSGIIYGPEYKRPENLDRLRARGLNAKRSLVLRELALGTEGLERFVRREPLRRVHECAFGVLGLGLESDPVDPCL